MSLEKQLEYLEKMMAYHEMVFDVDKESVLMTERIK